MYSNYEPNRQLFGLSVRWLTLAALLLAVAIVIGFGLNWFAKPMQMADPNNLAQLSKQANESWQALKAQQAMINGLDTKAKDYELTYGADRLKWPQGKSEEWMQIRAQVVNLKNAFNMDCAKYNALWQDEWRGGVGPHKPPTQI